MGRQLLHILTLILLTVVTNVTQGAESVGVTSAAMVKGGRAYSILTDQLGTPTEAYDSEGNEVWSRVLDMDGNVIEETGCRGMIPFLFQGQYYDPETGLAYNRFRYYDPKTGAYISQDPIGLAGNLNVYLYTENTNAEIDPLGLYQTPAQRAKEKGFSGVKMDHRGNVRFKDSPYMYKPQKGQKNRVVISLSGNYSTDFRRANKAAGLTSKPVGYTWHHVNYNPRTGKGTMELIRTSVHRATYPHSGGVAEYRKHHKTGYK